MVLFVWNVQGKPVVVNLVVVGGRVSEVKGSSLWSKIRKERGFRRLLLHGYLWVALIKKWGAHARSLRVCMNQETFFPSPFLSWIEGSSNALLLSLS
jgi:hypothetical protein